MDTYDALTKLATLVALIAARSHEALGTNLAQQINARCFEIVRAFADEPDDDKRVEVVTVTHPHGDKVCGDRCPTDTAERCEREPGHDGWHEGKRLRWRRR